MGLTKLKVQGQLQVQRLNLCEFDSLKKKKKRKKEKVHPHLNMFTSKYSIHFITVELIPEFRSKCNALFSVSQTLGHGCMLNRR